MNKIEQKLIHIDDPVGEVIDLDEYFEDGWYVKQISACRSGNISTSCYVLLERENVEDTEDDMICD